MTPSIPDDLFDALLDCFVDDDAWVSVGTTHDTVMRLYHFLTETLEDSVEEQYRKSILEAIEAREIIIRWSEEKKDWQMKGRGGI